MMDFNSTGEWTEPTGYMLMLMIALIVLIFIIRRI